MPGDDHIKGILITGAGVLAMTPDSLLIRLITADEWTVLFWRGLLSGLTIFAGLAALHRRALPRHVRAIGRSGIVFAVLFCAGTTLFILSVTQTKVANTLFIISSAPLFSAMIARFFLGEAVPARTWIAIGCTLLGIGVIASGSLERGGGSLIGDMAAVGAAVTMAGSLSIARKARARSLVPAMALSGLFTAVLALPLASPFAVETGSAVYLGLMGLLVIPLGFALMTLGPRYIPAPEVGLLLLLEAVLGPFWVWLVVQESPGPRGLAGGVIVIATLVISSLIALRAQRPATGTG